MKSKALALSLIMALVLTCIFYGVPVQPVDSQSFVTIYIMADGSVEGTDLIEIKNNNYTFLNDIYGSIVVSKDSIAIDGCGYVLRGSGESGSYQTGISLSDRKNVTVTNTVVMNYSIGISCRDTTGNITILDNYIDSCGIGVEFLGSSNNLVKYNTFKNNDIDVGFDYVSGNNIITYNNLDSYVQVWLSEQPTMDMNFWSDYTGTDSDGDGIGDSPYFYHDILQDNHPLMKPVVISPSPEPTPTNANMGPTSPPEKEPLLTQEQLVIIGIAITVLAVVLIGLGLLVYLIKRK